MHAQQIVEDFIAAWNRMDIAGAFAMMADDAVWHNIPMGPAKGMSEIQAVMAQFPPTEGIEFITHHIASNGNVVLTERTDKFLIDGKWRALRVMGTFEINDAGKIQNWRDYFDMAEMQREFA
ncbi:LimA Limonene-1,2-epoxide hydrolase [Sphingomonadaceae bacterium]|jgi:limonene-1,2-epoxide hydrolase|uniref:limonene-1,2-epoxide hydrolase family protein n=1 Tax=Sphingorhabdus sp. TaxID=1902408 RepID=UPI00308C7AB2|nr:nuclear transport factor 2 family protein [Sphingomonadales bacterium]WRH75188.1 MAG: limonene-1,2-epoxide hydrolase family protein [Sphingobium sp.]